MAFEARRRDRPSESAVAAEVKIRNSYETLINPATQETLFNILTQLDLTLSQLRDALRGALTKDFSTLEYDVETLVARVEAVRDRINELSAVLASTTTTLGAGATFTGSAFSVSGYGRIVGSCYADQAGTLRVEQRNNGANWDVRSEFAYTAGALLGFSVEVVGNEARLVYVNGATAQTVFRLYARARRI